jgi:hypothetical protein
LIKAGILDLNVNFLCTSDPTKKECYIIENKLYYDYNDKTD